MITTKKQEEKSSNSPVMKIAVIAAAVIALVGIVMLITNKVQQSDATLTQAPPAGPQAQTLTRSPQKSLHPGPMYKMTPSGPVLNQVGAASPSVGAGGYAQPVVMAPATTH